MSETRWQLFSPKVDLAQKLAAKINKSPVTAQLLLNRNINSLDAAFSYLNPSLNSPHTLDQQQLLLCSQVLFEAQSNHHKILIYGDYDVDGITSVTLFINFLRKTNPKIDYYIPNRFSEGYGLNLNAIDYIRANGIDLVITVDCGISNVEEITQIKQQTKAKVIVIDHHSLPDNLPPADAILNPKFLPPNHPLYYLAAAGTVYKFLEFYCNFHKIDYPLSRELDLVGLATIADMVPLLGENRTLAKHGLQALAQKDRLGIRTLLEVVGFKQPYITARDVGFILAPHLNAAGRLETAHLAVDLLISQNYDAALGLANKLKNMNTARQQIGATMLKEAEAQMQEENCADENILVLSGQQWNPGVIGITAAQLVRKYNKPAVLISTRNPNSCRGSARSFAQINIYHILKECAHFFTDFGGHKEAAGFTISYDQIPEFKAFLRAKTREQITVEHLTSVLDIDYHLTPNQISLDLAKELNDLAPFGQQNPVPVFYTNELTPIDFRAVGNGDHLKVTFANEANHLVFDAIGFNLSHKLELLYKQQVELAFNLEVNEWRGMSLPQLKLVDIK
jgi:single-stranded-DNA-specific exonuclease